MAGKTMRVGARRFSLEPSSSCPLLRKETYERTMQRVEENLHPRGGARLSCQVADRRDETGIVRTDIVLIHSAISLMFPWRFTTSGCVLEILTPSTL